MDGIMYYPSLLLVLLSFGVCTIRSLPMTSPSKIGLDDNLQRLKSNFSTPVVDALLKFDGFRKKFDVPYLEVATALRYSREIARAAAFNPMFENKNGIEEFAMEHLLRMVLPSSPDYCSNLNCVASRIGEILAEIARGAGFLTTQISDRILQMHAGNLAGNILWRLSRLPDPDEQALQRTPDVTIDRYARLLNRLSLDLKNSTLVSGFCDERGGLDARTSETISSSVCGSAFLGYDLSLLENVSRSMEQTYSASKNILHGYFERSIESLLVPSIIAETIIFNMLRRGFTLANDKVWEISHDLQKFIMLGITISKMKLDSTEPFVRYSFSANQRAPVGLYSIM